MTPEASRSWRSWLRHLKQREGVVIWHVVPQWPGFPDGSDNKESTCNARDLGWIPGLGRSRGEGNSYPFQYSGLENSMNKGAWQATVHGVTKSRMWLSDFHFHFHSARVSPHWAKAASTGREFRTLATSEYCQFPTWEQSFNLSLPWFPHLKMEWIVVVPISGIREKISVRYLAQFLVHRKEQLIMLFVFLLLGVRYPSPTPQYPSFPIAMSS